MKASTHPGTGITPNVPPKPAAGYPVPLDSVTQLPQSRDPLLPRVGYPLGVQSRDPLRIPAELQAADAYCRYLANRHYENFSVASYGLPSATRLHLARIYAFCRTTDDLGDESGPNALPRLTLWREEVERCFQEGLAPIHPVLLALAQTIAALRLPAEPFLDLIEANVQDQFVTGYDTWNELEQYCMLSAAPVGRLVLRVFGVFSAGPGTAVPPAEAAGPGTAHPGGTRPAEAAGPGTAHPGGTRPAEAAGGRAEKLSDAVCIGLQLANFAQDVSVDREKGRTYLIQSDIRALGVQGAIRAMCDRAEGLLAAGLELEDLVPLRLRVQLALYRLGGGAIVSAIRRMDYRTDERRPQLSRLEKARLIPLAVRQCRRRRGYAPGQEHVP